jgi:hypothetical protein
MKLILPGLPEENDWVEAAHRTHAIELLMNEQDIAKHLGDFHPNRDKEGELMISVPNSTTYKGQDWEVLTFGTGKGGAKKCVIWRTSDRSGQLLMLAVPTNEVVLPFVPKEGAEKMTAKSVRNNINQVNKAMLEDVSELFRDDALGGFVSHLSRRKKS